MGTTVDLSSRARAARQGREERSFTVEGVEMRQAADGSRTFYGVASTFNQPYVVHDAYGTFEETITPTAMDRSLANRGGKMHLFYGHGGIPLAASRSGTLRISADKQGLPVEADFDPDSPHAQSVASAVARGDVDEMSIGFSVPEGGDTWNDDYSQRTINEMKLYEVSIVPRGANGNTSASVRALNVDPDDVASIRSGIARLEQLLDKTEPSADTFDPDLIGRMQHLWARRIGGYPAPGNSGLDTTDTPNLPTGPAPQADTTDVTDLLLALDATIDDLEAALAAGDITKSTALCAAADTTIDAVLEALGIPDTDELAEQGDKGATGE